MLPPAHPLMHGWRPSAFPKEELDDATDDASAASPVQPAAASGRRGAEAAERDDDRARLSLDPGAGAASGRKGRQGGAVARQARRRAARGGDRGLDPDRYP